MIETCGNCYNYNKNQDVKGKKPLKIGKCLLSGLPVSSALGSGCPLYRKLGEAGK